MYSKKFSFKKNFVVGGVLLGLLIGIVLPGECSAVTLDNALSVRSPFALPPVNDTSYDGPGFDAFKPFQTFTSSDFYEVGAFTGSNQGGSTLEFFLISEVAFYDGQVAGLGDVFGLLDSNGDFSSVIAAPEDPGYSTSLFQGQDEEFTLALQSPEGLFSSIDEDNPDKAPHFIAQEVTQAGQVTIQNANLLGAALTFNLQVGDIILYIEDLLTRGNMLNNGIPSDFDYNDMVVVLRSEPIPEPATCLLLGAGLSAMGVARRRRRMLA